MTLRQFEYFVAVVDEGSFTRAAHRLYVAQPSLSKQLAALERELGATLVERLPRGFRLTAAGRAFLPEARAAIQSGDRAKRAVQMARDLAAAELEVASVLSVAVGILPRAIYELNLAHPGVTTMLREYRHSAVMEDEVRNGAADIAVGPAPQRWDGPIMSLGWEELVVLFPPGDDALHTPGPVDLRHLAHRRWVLPDDSAGLAAPVRQACAEAGFTPRPVARSSQIETLMRLVDAGLGPTIVPENVVAASMSHLSRRMTRPVARELTAYARTQWSPGARAFCDALNCTPGLSSARPPENAATGDLPPS
jgi:DNA-binding transcriptional LysR family regulator